MLHVISSSPGELEPVFETMLANATRICEATRHLLAVREGDAFRAVCSRGMCRPTSESGGAIRCSLLSPGNALGRAAATKQTVQIADVQANRPIARSPAHRVGVDSWAFGPWSRADAQGEASDRRHRHLPPGGPPVHRQADRAG